MPTYDFDAFVFDLDGTLLHTMPDLVAITNETMRRYGFPEYTYEGVQQMVGNGAQALVQQAVPEGTDPQLTAEALAFWKEAAVDHGFLRTAPFPGIEQVLRELRAAGKKIGVLSNKFQAGVEDQLAHHLPGLFDVALGDGTVPRKPDPTGLLEMAKRLGTEPERMAYFGDSEGDMRAARAAGAFAVGVTWGYQSIEKLQDGGAQLLLDSPNQILTLL